MRLSLSLGTPGAGCSYLIEWTCVRVRLPVCLLEIAYQLRICEDVQSRFDSLDDARFDSILHTLEETVEVTRHARHHGEAEAPCAHLRRTVAPNTEQIVTANVLHMCAGFVSAG
jgi:hypothetical protein